MKFHVDSVDSLAPGERGGGGGGVREAKFGDRSCSIGKTTNKQSNIKVEEFVLQGSLSDSSLVF